MRHDATKIDRTCRLRLPWAARRRLERALTEARRLSDGDAGEALRLLCAEARVIEALSDRATREGGTRLPHGQRRTRIEEYIEALIGAGDAPLTEARLTDALRGRGFTQDRKSVG